MITFGFGFIPFIPDLLVLVLPAIWGHGFFKGRKQRRIGSGF